MKRARTYSSAPGASKKIKKSFIPKTIEELKFFDTGIAPTVLVSSATCAGGEIDPAIDCLNAMAIGSSDEDRIGKTIVMKSIYVTGQIQLPTGVDQTVLANPKKVFIALVLDKQPNGATLNSEDVYQNVSNSAPMCACPQRNARGTSRFRVLATHEDTLELTTSLHDGTNFEYSGQVKPFKLSYDLKGMKASFRSSVGGDITDIETNALHMIAFCSDTSGIPTIGYNARLRYYG